jgi:hypothetical protein
MKIHTEDTFEKLIVRHLVRYSDYEQALIITAAVTGPLDIGKAA